MGLLNLPNHVWAELVGGAFAFCAIALSLYEVYRHIQHTHHMYVRRYIIRILLMVVVYAIESFCGIFYPSASVYLNALRDLYEVCAYPLLLHLLLVNPHSQAITIYSFFQLLINALGGFQAVLRALQRNHDEPVPHLWPFKYCLSPWSCTDADYDAEALSEQQPLFRAREHRRRRGTEADFSARGARSNPFFRHCTMGVLQYCLVQTICCALTFVLSLCGVYGDGDWDFSAAAYPYLVLVISASQSWAIYCLALFYTALASMKSRGGEDAVYLRFVRLSALGKFVCIKGIVFFTYWQSVCIDLLVFVGLIHDDMMGSAWSADAIASSLQDFIICIEMLVFAVAHHYALNPKDFVFADFEEAQSSRALRGDGDAADTGLVRKMGEAMLDAVNPKDIVINAHHTMDLRKTGSPRKELMEDTLL